MNNVSGVLAQHGGVLFAALGAALATFLAGLGISQRSRNSRGSSIRIND